MKKILVIEDDLSLLNGMVISLEKEGYSVTGISEVSHVEQILLHEEVNMIIMDLNLPGGDGIDLCKTIRETSNIPMIMVTARDLEQDEIIGIESGADDYITKPFSLSILMARIKSLFRRSENSTNKNTIELNHIALDLDQVKLYVRNVEVEVTAIEFKIIKLLMENQGRVLLKDVILEQIWDSRGSYVDDNTLSVNIRRIREKIEQNPSKPEHIRTIRGMGYIWHSS